MSPAPTCTAPCCATSAGATASGGSTGRSTSIKRSSTIDRAGAMTSGSWRGSAVLLLVAPLVGAALVAPTRESVLYVSNEVSNSITAISPRSVGAIATIAVGRRPRGMALSPDHRTAYVALGEDNALGVIDVAAAKMTGTLPAGRDPELVVLSPDGKTAYVSNERSEEHTSELQSPCNLVCRLLLEKKKKKQSTPITAI